LRLAVCTRTLQKRSGAHVARAFTIQTIAADIAARAYDACEIGLGRHVATPHIGVADDP
jgi:hypothetical protein